MSLSNLDSVKYEEFFSFATVSSTSTFSSEFTIGDKIDVAGNLEINSFNGTDSIQINLKDMMKSI